MLKAVRGEWVERSQFHAFDDAEVLRQVIEGVRRTRLAGKKPAVVFDLDSTLYEVAPRTHAILLEWASSNKNSPLSAVLGGIQLEHVGYSLRDTFRKAGLTDPQGVEALREVKDYWSTRFFNNSHLYHDRVYEKASDYVRAIYSEGAEVIYLTGRDEPNMGVNTRENLRRDGFPIDMERTSLILKADSVIEDLEHKKLAGEKIRKTGDLVAQFENEPKNLVALAELFPASMHVFVETVCSDHPAPIWRDLYRIKRFVYPL